MNALAGHMLGDWLLQNRWLAAYKRTSALVLGLHVLIVTLCVAAFTGWWDYRFAVHFTLHLAIDGIGLGKNWPDWFGQGDPDSNAPAPMWLRLMADQALHVISLALIGMLPVG
jgi:hypothetical protein